MNRRDFLIATAAVTLAMPLRAQAAAVDYSPELLQAELAAGKTVFLDFKASWCSTCAAQERVITALLQENPAYAQGVSFINVDWDQWGEGDLVKQLNIPRRSTLVVPALGCSPAATHRVIPRWGQRSSVLHRPPP